MAGIFSKIVAVVEHSLVFAGDLLPYGVVFLITLMVGYGLGLEAAATFSLAYAYVAIITALVCGPNLLSLRRRMPLTNSPGAVVASAILLRAAAIGTSSLLLIAMLEFAGAKNIISLVSWLMLARFVETSIDGPAISVQYLRGARDYLVVRLSVFALTTGVTAIGLIGAASEDLSHIAKFYLLGAIMGLALASFVGRNILRPIVGILSEANIQVTDFGRFFLATALFLAASRLHPVIISYFSGTTAAGQFAMVQNLFASISLAATGVAGVFFWSRNRIGAKPAAPLVPWAWLAGALVGGLLFGGVGGFILDFLFLTPLGSTVELRTVSWLLCISTPMLLAQAILSNQLVLLKRDREMLLFSAVNGALGLLLMSALTYRYGMIGAALSTGLSALLSTLFGIAVVRNPR